MMTKDEIEQTKENVIEKHGDDDVEKLGRVLSSYNDKIEELDDLVNLNTVALRLFKQNPNLLFAKHEYEKDPEYIKVYQEITAKNMDKKLVSMQEEAEGMKVVASAVEELLEQKKGELDE